MALVTLSELKTFLGITDDSQDTVLQIYVDSANVFVKKYCERDLEETSYLREQYDGSGTAELVLRQYPLISVEGVWVEGDELDESTDNTDQDGWYIYKEETGILRHRLYWDRARGNIEVSYTAGYETVPSDLKHCCLLISSYFRNMGNRQGIRSESLGSYAYSLANDMASMGGDLTIPDVVVKNILNRYRMRYIGGVY